MNRRFQSCQTIRKKSNIRVLDLLFKHGTKWCCTHPDHFVYPLTNSKIRIESEDGKSNDIELKVGKVVCLEIQTHAAEKIRETDSHNLVEELK
jgi:hypothetical protein